MKSVDHFLDSSHCQQSFFDEPNELSHMEGKIIPAQSRLGIVVSESTPVHLTVVNSGSGTTGTHSVFDSMCLYKYQGVHFRLSCNFPDDMSRKNKSKRQALEQWHVLLTRCVLSSSLKVGCQPSVLLDKLRGALVDTLSVIEFLTDSPTDVLFSEIINLAPEAKVVGTYRNPRTWAKRRVRTHSTQLVCRSELWVEPTVLHPFDVVGCLQLKRSLDESLMTVFEFLHGVDFDAFKKMSQDKRKGFSAERNIFKIELAYQWMNTANRRLLQARHMPFLAVCLWDLPKGNESVLHSLVGGFLGSGDTSRRERRQLSGQRSRDYLNSPADMQPLEQRKECPYLYILLSVILFIFIISVYRASKRAK